MNSFVFELLVCSYDHSSRIVVKLSLCIVEHVKKTYTNYACNVLPLWIWIMFLNSVVCRIARCCDVRKLITVFVLLLCARMICVSEGDKVDLKCEKFVKVSLLSCQYNEIAAVRNQSTNCTSKESAKNCWAP